MMTGKDAGGQRKFKSFLSMAGGALAVLALCVVARTFWGPQSATAQNVGPRPAARPATRPTPRGATRSTSDRPAAGQPAARTASRPAPRSTATANIADPQLKVMALVNGQQVTRDQLASECLRRYGKEVLEGMVNKHLIFQACQAQGVKITAQEVEQEIKETASKFGLAKDVWMKTLEEERDISPAHYRNEVIWPTLALRRLAAPKLVVTEQELRKAVESKYGPAVRVRMISVSSPQKAEQLHRQAIQNPKSFGQLAKEHSEDSNTAATRGLIPPIRRHVGPIEVERVVFSLKSGQISAVVHVANQYLIFQCEEQIEQVYLSGQKLAQIQGRLEDEIRDEKLRTAATDLFASLQQRAKVINVYNNPQLKQQMPGAAATINGRQITTHQLAEQCLIAHGKAVLEGEINRLVLQQELQRRAIQVAQPDIDDEISRAADAYGYLKDGRPDIQGWLKTVTETDNVTVDLYVRDAVWPSAALKKLVNEHVEVTNDDLQKGFAANYGERVEALAIVLSSQRQASKVWEQARANPTEAFFGELAHQYSIEPVSRANYGKIPPLRRYGGQPVIEEEAFNLKAGELSGILAMGDKFIILRCLGRTKPVVQDFNAVKDELFKDIHEKKLRLAMSKEFDRLIESAKIDNFLAGTTQSPPAAAGPRRSVSPASFQNPSGRPAARTATGTAQPRPRPTRK